MIKKYPTNSLGEAIEMVYCDHCGEGLARQSDNNPDVKEFVFLHYDCTKPKNDNLGFLDKAESLV
jgi:hypothetical protein